MHFSARAIAPAAQSRQAERCTSPIGAMHPATGTGTGIQVFAKAPLKWAISPHFSYESPALHRCSQSPNSCTRPQLQALRRKSRASKGGVRKTPLRRPIFGDARPRPAVRGMGYTPTLPPSAGGHRRRSLPRHQNITPRGAGPCTRHSRPKPPGMQCNRCSKPDTEPRKTSAPLSPSKSLKATRSSFGNGSGCPLRRVSNLLTAHPLRRPSRSDSSLPFPPLSRTAWPLPSPPAVAPIQPDLLRQDAPSGKDLYLSHPLHHHQSDHVSKYGPVPPLSPLARPLLHVHFPKGNSPLIFRNRPLPRIASRNRPNAPFSADFTFGKPPTSQKGTNPNPCTRV